MTMTTGSGKEEMTALSCAALSASFFISEGLGGEETNKKKQVRKQTGCRRRLSSALT